MPTDPPETPTPTESPVIAGPAIPTLMPREAPDPLTEYETIRLRELDGRFHVLSLERELNRLRYQASQEGLARREGVLREELGALRMAICSARGLSAEETRINLDTGGFEHAPHAPGG